MNSRTFEVSMASAKSLDLRISNHLSTVNRDCRWGEMLSYLGIPREASTIA